MNIEHALTTILVNEHPQFLQVSKESQKKIIKRLIKTAVSRALENVHLPPIKDVFQRKIDEYHFKRSSEHYRHTHKLPNYVLLQKLHDLRKNESNSNGTDFLNMLKIESSTLGKQLLDSVMNIERHPRVNFENFSENNVRTKVAFFKLSKIDYSIFNSEKDTRNFITRFKIKLFENFTSSMIVFASNTNQVIQISSQKFTFSKNQKFTEDLFLLYDLQSFLNFLHILEKVSIETPNLKDSLNYAYDVLYDYYFEFFKINNHEFQKDQLIEYVLQNDDFRNLSDENPLSLGFIKLFTHSIDLLQLLQSIDAE